ncbi:MAG: YceI family protein [Bacteroidetes bacterium]|nr:YceI family protein [Bacteroidota bacterium]
MKKLYILTSISGIGIFVLLFAFYFQTEKFTLDESTIRILGTSTLRDWETVSRDAEGEAELGIRNGNIHAINALTIRVPAESLKSGNRNMDRHTYDALNAEAHPHIIFFFKDVEQIAAVNGTMRINAIGDLTVAGVTKAITLTATGSITKSLVTFEGNHFLKMTDFNIEPPTALLGTVKADDEISIQFLVSFKPASEAL